VVGRVPCRGGLKLAAIICGDRNWGEKHGVDTCARKAARALGIACKPMPADWQRYGRAAGPIRNKEMLAFLLHLRWIGWDVLTLAFHEHIEESKGTKNMLDQAGKAGVRCWLYEKGATP
jgi:hypothetical protein